MILWASSAIWFHRVRYKAVVLLHCFLLKHTLPPTNIVVCHRRHSGVRADSNNPNRDHRAQVHRVQAGPVVQGDGRQKLPTGRQRRPARQPGTCLSPPPSALSAKPVALSPFSRAGALQLPERRGGGGGCGGRGGAQPAAAAAGARGRRARAHAAREAGRHQGVVRLEP